jgi:hypothetical protein
MQLFEHGITQAHVKMALMGAFAHHAFMPASSSYSRSKNLLLRRCAMASEFDSGYTQALTQLQNNLRLDKTISTSSLDKVLKHIQDLIQRCQGCGGWLYSDGSCLTCEQMKVEIPVKKAVKKK